MPDDCTVTQCSVPFLVHFSLVWFALKVPETIDRDCESEAVGCTAEESKPQSILAGTAYHSDFNTRWNYVDA